MLLKERAITMTIEMICILYVCLYIYTCVCMYMYISIFKHMCSLNVDKKCQTERLKEREDVAQGKCIWNGYTWIYTYVYIYRYICLYLYIYMQIYMHAYCSHVDRVEKQ